MKVKKFALLNTYLKMMENSFKEHHVDTNETAFIYFASYYINKFLPKDFSIKGYIGFKKQETIKDTFIISVPIEEITKKTSKIFLNKYFEDAIKYNERYIGLIKTSDKIGWMFKHDEELLNAYKTGQYSKISEVKKNKMRRFKMLYLDFDMLDFDIKIPYKKIRHAYIYFIQRNANEGKKYTLRKKDLIRYELFKMIYPEIFYPVLAEHFNVKTDYLKKNNVQIVPKPNLEKDYLELSEKDEIYWFDKK